MLRLEIALACVFGLVAATASADDLADQLSRSVELPAHRWLQNVRDDPGTKISAFETDGCSGGMSSLWSYVAGQYPAFAKAHGGLPPWEQCCVTHDRAYHAAGPDPDPDASYDARLTADTVLRECVKATSDSRDAILQSEYGLSDAQVRAIYRGISEAMFLAVRLGGGPCTGLPWRWGFGYPLCWQTLRE